MRSKIAQLADQKSTLEKHLSNADNTWQDKTKQTFFVNHAEPIRHSYSNQADAMEQMTAIIEKAEKEIESLM